MLKNPIKFSVCINKIDFAILPDRINQRVQFATNQSPCAIEISNQSWNKTLKTCKKYYKKKYSAKKNVKNGNDSNPSYFVL